MGSVFTDIEQRLKQLSIDINQYIYHEDGKSTLKEGPSTLEGIKFVAQNKVVLNLT